MQVAKWGNSLAVRLPTAVVKALDLRAGDEIEIDVVGDRKMEVRSKDSLAALRERLAPFKGMLPEDFRFDRDQANAR